MAYQVQDQHGNQSDNYVIWNEVVNAVEKDMNEVVIDDGSIIPINAVTKNDGYTLIEVHIEGI